MVSSARSDRNDPTFSEIMACFFFFEFRTADFLGGEQSVYREDLRHEHERVRDLRAEAEDHGSLLAQHQITEGGRKGGENRPLPLSWKASCLTF